MNTRNLFPGVALITLGVLFLGEKLGWFHLDVTDFARFWPLLLILAGINLVLRRTPGGAAALTTVLLAVAVPLAVISAFRTDDRQGAEVYEGQTDETDDERPTPLRRDRFAEPMDSSVREATFQFDGGAGTFVIAAAADSLVEASTRTTVGGYSMSVNRTPETHAAEVSLQLNDNGLHIRGGKLENRVEVNLNPAPLWNFDLDFGAGRADLDLTAYAVRTLTLDAGAADVEVKLGDRAAESWVEIESGVASVTLNVPKTVGCQIELDGALNDSNLEGFSEVGRNLFRTPDYDRAAKKLTIRYEGGLSRVKVKRY